VPSGSPAVQVTRLFRYPVKSLAGEEIPALEIGPQGPAGDRMFGVVDAATGRVLSAKRLPRLLTAQARMRGGEVEVILPGGHLVRAGGAEADGAFSDWLGRKVRLERRRGGRALVDYEPNPYEPTGLVSFDLPPGNFADTAPVHLLSESSLRDAARERPSSNWDITRFRPNVFLAGAGGPRTEDGWVDRHLAIGSVLLAVTEPCLRCVMVNHAQGGLPADDSMFRWLLRARSGTLGVHATVARAGLIRGGDRLTVLDSPRHASPAAG
jgi:MOSC domain-containing protein